MISILGYLVLRNLHSCACDRPARDHVFTNCLRLARIILIQLGSKCEETVITIYYLPVDGLAILAAVG